MRELRGGRKNLKKLEETVMGPSCYELTPYEALMKDIKDKKYQLKQVMVSEWKITLFSTEKTSSPAIM